MEKKASSLTAHFHLPGLFEFYDFYRVFLPLYRKHRDFFYDWCEIDSIYGSAQDCLWGGGRTSDGRADAKKVLSLVDEFGISPRLTFSNSLIREEHFCDKKCNSLCEIFKNAKAGAGGYRFSKAMKNPGFISVRDIQEKYLPLGFSNFKIEGRGLGSAMLLEFLLYYMTKPEHQLEVREEIYLDSMLDLF